MGKRARFLLRVIPHILLTGVLVTAAYIGRQWAYVTTYRLFLDQRIDETPGSAATQWFDLENGHVVPKILTRGDRAIFRPAVGQDSTIRATVRSAPTAGFEVRLHQQGRSRVVASGAGGPAPVAMSAPFPRGDGEIEIASRGDVTWIDLRVERGLDVARPLALLTLLLASLLAWMKFVRPRLSRPAGAPSRGRRIWLSILTVCTSLTISLLLLEAVLRAVAPRLSPGISAFRHDLGEATDDPRWQQTARYGQRLRPNIDAPSEWRYGDIIRMGFVPPAAGEGLLHRYSFHADSEGFRNDAPRDPISVAALGDSFTDALTMRREDAWPAQLEARIGRPVQNYGTAGFGPQQELLVLQDFALRHHPQTVVLAFFAGNDIRDAEAFEIFQRGETLATQRKLGWPIKPIATRADTWFLVSALQAATNVRAQLEIREAGDSAHTLPDGATRERSSGPSFDRGVFTVEVNGRMLRWALMPPYLNLLNFDEQDLSARRGWTLIQEQLIEMRRVSSEAGADFVVVFIPFKSQVYLPLLERSFDRPALAEALHFYLRDRGVPDIDRLSRNRLAQNRLMARFCERAGLPLLDLTPVLEARVDAGEQMYFPDDSHLNEAGQAELAAALAAFLAARQSGR